MFVASYARLPSITVRDTTSVPLHYGSGPLLQCAVPPRYRSGPLLQCAVPPRYRSGPPLQCAVPPRYRSGPLLQCAVPPRYRSGPPVQCAVPPRYRSGPLLQCAVPPRYRFGTARALYYTARYRHPVWALQSFNWIGVRNFQENTKTNGKPRNLNIVVPALLQTGRFTLAPRHSKCTSRSTILFGWSVACRLLV